MKKKKKGGNDSGELKKKGLRGLIGRFQGAERDE